MAMPEKDEICYDTIMLGGKELPTIHTLLPE